MINTRKRMAVGGVMLAVVLLCTGCPHDKFTEPFADAPRSGQDNGAPMNVIQGADGFSNIGWKCVGADGVYAAYHGDKTYASIFVLANDPNCAPGSTVPGAHAK